MRVRDDFEEVTVKFRQRERDRNRDRDRDREKETDILQHPVGRKPDT